MISNTFSNEQLRQTNQAQATCKAFPTGTQPNRPFLQPWHPSSTKSYQNTCIDYAYTSYFVK